MKAIIDKASADVIDDLLSTVRVRTSVYCRSEMRAPWGFGVESRANPSFHVVIRGSCFLEVDGDETQRPLQGGDLVLLPHGTRHWMRDAPSSRVQWLEHILGETPIASDGWLRHGGNGELTELLCGGFVLEAESVDPVLRALPRVLHIRGVDGKPVPWVSATLTLVGAVTSSATAGGDAALARLTETMVTQALRAALAEFAFADAARTRALRDPQIAAAVRLIHAQPDLAWTVERLAAHVGYSRSAFASRFRETVGESPIAYVTRSRLATAAALLTRTKMSIREVATRAGYSSDASFGRAFKRAFGIAPGYYRVRASRRNA